MNSHKKIFQLTVLIVALLAVANGQTADKKTLTLQGAEQVIAAAKSEAKKLQAPGGVIAVVDDGGNLMALERLDGTFSAGANISIGKAKTAVMFKKPTRFFEELINSSGKGRTVMTALENFTPLIGGIPIIVDSQIVGGVGVSGASSADQSARENQARHDEEVDLFDQDQLRGVGGLTHSEPARLQLEVDEAGLDRFDGVDHRGDPGFRRPDHRHALLRAAIGRGKPVGPRRDPHLERG